MIVKIVIGIIGYFVSIIAISTGVKIGLKEYFKEVTENENKSSE